MKKCYRVLGILYFSKSELEMEFYKALVDKEQVIEIGKQVYLGLFFY